MNHSASSNNTKPPHLSPSFADSKALEVIGAKIELYERVIKGVEDPSSIEPESSDIAVYIGAMELKDSEDRIEKLHLPNELVPEYFKYFIQNKAQLAHQLELLSDEVIDPGVARDIKLQNPSNPEQMLEAAGVAILSRKGFIGKLIENLGGLKLVKEAIRTGKTETLKPLTIMRIDIGDFRLVDEVSRAMGDYTLNKIAESMVNKCVLINQVFKKLNIDIEVIVGRESGDEFVVGLVGNASPNMQEIVYDLFVNQYDGLQSIDTYQIERSGSKTVIPSKVKIKNKREKFETPVREIRNTKFVDGEEVELSAEEIKELKKEIERKKWKHLLEGKIVDTEGVMKEIYSGEIKIPLWASRAKDLFKSLTKSESLIQILEITNKKGVLKEAYTRFMQSHNSNNTFKDFAELYIYDKNFEYPFYKKTEIIHAIEESQSEGKDYTLYQWSIPFMSVYNQIPHHGAGDAAIDSLGWSLLETIMRYQLMGYDIRISHSGPTFTCFIPDQAPIEGSELQIIDLLIELDRINKSRIVIGDQEEDIFISTNRVSSKDISLRRGQNIITPQMVFEELYLTSESKSNLYLVEELKEDEDNFIEELKDILTGVRKFTPSNLSELLSNRRKFILFYLTQKRSAKRIQAMIDTLESSGGSEYLINGLKDTLNVIPEEKSEAYQPSDKIKDFVNMVRMHSRRTVKAA